MDKGYIRQILLKAFYEGEQYGILGESDNPSDHKKADKKYKDFKEWLELEIDALDYL